MVNVPAVERCGFDGYVGSKAHKVGIQHILHR